MLLEHPDELLSWLTVYLEPMCDADPGALAKYVLALLKKEKPMTELRKAMEDNMYVFLQEKTGEVLDHIFDALKSGKYLSKEEREADSTTPVRPALDSVVVAVDKSKKESGAAKGRGSPRRGSPHRGSPRGSPPRGRRLSRSRSRSPQRRRSAGHRYRSRSPEYRRVRRSSPPPRRRRSRSKSYSPPPVFSRLVDDNNPYKSLLCRDYEEQGFCMKGDQCKFDHGKDAVVVSEKVGSSGSSSANRGDNVPYQPSSAFNEPYVPAATVSLPPLHVPPPVFMPKPVDVPLFPPPPVTAKLSVYDRLGKGQRGGHFRGRGARGRGYGGSGRGATQIAVRNIPFHLNTIAHMNNHFAQFGNLVNVQVHFEGDPASALISFSSPEEADMAYNCPDMVMGNKFIRMYFHHARPAAAANKRPFAPFKPRETVSMEGGTLVKTVLNENAKDESSEGGEPATKISKHPASPSSAALKKFEELLESKVAKKREAEEQQSEKLRKMSEIKKSKQDILHNLIEEQKKLITKLETSKETMTAEEKTKIMELSRTLTSAIEKAKKDVEESMKPIASAVKKNPAEIQKDLLDAELELFQAQQEGAIEENSDVEKRVNALRIEAAKAGLLPTSRGRGRGFRGSRGFARGYAIRRGFAPRFRGRGGRGRGVMMMSIDRRPSRIHVANFDWDHKEEVVEHFQTFGVVVETAEDEANGSLIVQFRSRKEAEVAMNSGKMFKAKPLDMSWHVTESHDLSSDQLDTSLSSNNASLLEEEQEDVNDDYQPLDPAYLPPGLHDEQKEVEDEEANLEDSSQTTPLHQITKEEEEALLALSPHEKGDGEEEEEEEANGRSWKP